MSKREDYIKPVDIEGLISAARQGQIDKSSEELLKSESEYIEAWRIKRGAPEQNSDGSSSYGKTQDNLIGLGLSGGGIRSATFSLGVMQALAKEKLFKYIDYLSTVSGGGYIGSAITWLKSPKSDTEKESYFENPDDFPFGTGDSEN